MKHKSKINIGIVGPGRVAARHANAIQHADDAVLWSVCGREVESAKCFAEKFQSSQAACQYFDNLSAMLSDPKLDAVIIATPDKLHSKHILLSLEAGKSLLTEKPLCTSMEACDQLSKFYRDKNNVFSVGYHLRWHDGIRKITKLCHQNALGNPIHLRLHWGVNFHEHGKWRTDAEYSRWFCLTVLGTHLMDIMRWLMVPLCGEVKQRKPIIKKYHVNKSFDETVLIIFEFESGATAEIFCSLIFDAPFRLELYTDSKTIIGDDLCGDGRNIHINSELFPFKKNNPYLSQLNDFLSAIRTDKKPEVGLEEGIKNIALMLNL